MTGSRDASGHLVTDTTKFPSGMKALGDYFHARGLKFGIYEDSGFATCTGFPGSGSSGSGSPDHYVV
jgi:alpha-galactosidase